MATATQRKMTITLESADVLQILDALNERAQAWENTEALLLGELESGDEFFIAEECDEPSEAAEIAQHFRDIISTIESQLENSK